MWRRAVVAAALLVGTAPLLLVTAPPVAAAAQVSLSPSAGGPGSAFTVTGSGFPAGDVEIRWDSQSDPLLATAAGPSFSVVVAVPDDAVPNSHPVLAVVRNGNAVSTSTAAFQVGDAPVEPTSTTAPADTTTTVATVTTTAPPTTSPSTTAASTAPTGASGGISGRGASGVTGGIDPAELETTTGQSSPAGGSGATAAPSTPTGDGTLSPSSPASPSSQASTPTSAAVGGNDPSGAALPAPLPGGEIGAEAAGAAPGGSRGTTVALGPRPASQSAGAVRSPTLLVLGLLMAVAGAGVLAVRSRRQPGPPPDIPFTS